MATETRKHARPHDEIGVQRQAQRPHEITPRDREWDTPSFSPFSFMRQGIDEMERWLGHIGWPRGLAPGAPGWGGPGGRGMMSQTMRQKGEWMPAIDAFQRGGEFVIRAELPGMSRQDLSVEIGDDAITLHGERKREFEDDREGVVWSERSYGSFTRVIPLPSGAIGDSAKATFTNGILEIVMQAPSPEARRGRRIDISGASTDDRK